MRRTLLRVSRPAIALLLATCFGAAYAQTAPAPTAPDVTYGNYTVTYTPASGSAFTQLQERVGSSGAWIPLAPESDYSIRFTGKSDATYYYRTSNLIGGRNSYTIYSDAIRVIVTSSPIPAPEELSDQLRYTYGTRVGDINADGREDIYLYRAAGGQPGNGTISKVILKQLSGGKFTPIVPTSAQISAATAWPTAYIDTALADVNADGYVDVGLSEVSTSIPGALDQIVYSSGQILDDLPKGLTNITTTGQDSFQRFYDEFMAWADNPNYYEDNKVWVEGPGHWDYDVVCDWWFWGQQWEYECSLEPFWVDGPEYWSYAHFNQDGYRLAKEIAKILNGNPDASVWAAVDILEEVLGVDIGGWNFDISFPGGIDANVSIGYSLILALASTEDVRTNQTPACITNDYHNDRLDAFLAPSSFVSKLDNYLGSKDVTLSGYVISYEVLQMLLDTWSSNRYAFVDGFGWFDARHASVGFGIGFNSVAGELAVDVFESIWETWQERVLEACTSAFIREDIYSNHVGARAGEAYFADRSKTPGYYIRSEINATLLTKSQATATLIAEGLISP